MVDHLMEGDEVALAGECIGRRVVQVARGGKYIDVVPPPAGVREHALDGVLGRWVESLCVVRMPSAVEPPPEGAWDAPS